jgi:hypothetical protein
MDREMGTLPGVSRLDAGRRLGIQARRDELPDQVQLDMLRAIGQRADMDAARPRRPANRRADTRVAESAVLVASADWRLRRIVQASIASEHSS